MKADRESRIIDTSLMELLFLLLFVFFLAAASLYQRLENIQPKVVTKPPFETNPAEPKDINKEKVIPLDSLSEYVPRDTLKDFVPRDTLRHRDSTWSASIAVAEQRAETAENRVKDLEATAPGPFSCFPRQPKDSDDRRQYAYVVRVNLTGVTVNETWNTIQDESTREKLRQIQNAEPSFLGRPIGYARFKSWTEQIARQLYETPNVFEKSCRLWVRVTVDDVIEQDAKAYQQGMQVYRPGEEKRPVYQYFQHTLQYDKLIEDHFYVINSQIDNVVRRYATPPGGG